MSEQALNQTQHASPQFSAQSAPQQLFGDYVAMRSGELWLVMPQSQVSNAERLEKFPDRWQPSDVLGLYQMTTTHNGKVETDLYGALSENMLCLPSIPDDRFLVTRFVGGKVFWCWDEVQVLIDSELQLTALPEVIKTSETPVQAIVTWAPDYKGFWCSADSFNRFAMPKSSG